MQASRLLILLLLLATALVDLVLLVAVSPVGVIFLQSPHHPLRAVLFSLAYGQVSVAAIWAGLGRTALPWRLAGPVGVAAFWSVGLAYALGGRDEGRTDIVVFLLLYGLIILAISLVVRSKGGRLANRLKTDAKPEEPRWQFSLGRMFAWLTATAIMLGLLRYTVDYDTLMSGRYARFPWLIVSVAGLSNAAVSFATLWSVMGNRKPLLRWAVLCLAIAGGLSILPLQGYPVAGLPFRTLRCLLQVVWMWVLLRVLRTAGIEFVWMDRGR